MVVLTDDSISERDIPNGINPMTAFDTTTTAKVAVRSFAFTLFVFNFYLAGKSPSHFTTHFGFSL